jgi:hypothetical protein
MSDKTARLGLPQLVTLQELNTITWNEALEQLDGLIDLCLLGRFINTPPPSPQDGDAYLIGGTPSGAWNGYPYKIASCRDGAWRFYTPFDGLRAYDATAGTIQVYRSGVWIEADYVTKSGSETLANKTLSAPVISGGTIDNAAIGGTAPATGCFSALGVNATADSTNKLAVASAASLFDNIGNGVQLKLNKRANGDTASVLYQTNYAGRAEIGLCGDDNFHFKVSPDGSSWTDAIVLDRTTGRASFATPPAISSIVNSGILSLPTSNDTLVGRTTTDTLSNKTLASATLSGTTSLPGSGVINTSGAIGIGTNSPAGRLTVYDSVTAGGTPSFNVSSNKTSQTVFRVDNTTSRNWEFGVGGSASVIGNGYFYFYDTTAQAARLVFDTSANLWAGVNIVPLSANTRNLGSASYYWANGYIQNAWTVVSDETLKDEIAGLGSAEMAVAKEIASLIAVYKMKSAIAEKGSEARKHCGWIAQRIEEAFAAHGLDPFAYGCVGFDWATTTVTTSETVSRPKADGTLDSDGNPAMETVEERRERQVPDLDENGERRKIHNLRIEEVTAFALAGLAARVTALEAERSDDH